MIRVKRLEHRFVQNVPERLEAGVLYISVEYGTAIHQCCCGCGDEVVTPLTPTGWTLIYDGATASLWPSVGNWHNACRSHYFIERGQVHEAGPWSSEQIARERERDRAAKGRFHALVESGTPQAPADHREPAPQLASAPQLSGLQRFVRWMLGVR